MCQDNFISFPLNGQRAPKNIHPGNLTNLDTQKNDGPWKMYLRASNIMASFWYVSGQIVL